MSGADHRPPATDHSVVVLGLTGPIASGKTSAARALAARGAEVIELDAVGHALLAEPAVRAEVDAAFPEVAGVGDLPELRKRLGEIVFADPEKLARLERVLHERMCDRVRERVGERRAAGGGGAVVIAGALLYEMGLAEACDAVIVVDAPEALRAERAAAARGWSLEEIRRRQARQLAAEVKRGRAERAVDNTGTLEELGAAMASILEEYTCP